MILIPLFQQQTITTFLGTNPAQVAWRSITKDILKSIAKDIQSLSSQSECAFNDIHCFSIHLCHLKHAYLSVEDTKWLMVWCVEYQVNRFASKLWQCLCVFWSEVINNYTTFTNTEVNHCFQTLDQQGFAKAKA